MEPSRSAAGTPARGVVKRATATTSLDGPTQVGDIGDVTQPDIVIAPPTRSARPFRPPVAPAAAPAPARVAPPVARAPRPTPAPPLPPSAPPRMQAPVIDLATARAERASSAAFVAEQGQSPAQSMSTPAMQPATSAALALPLMAPPEPVVAPQPQFQPYPVAAIPAPAPLENPYAVFEQIGLAAPTPVAAAPASQRAQKYVVSTYRLLGFVILTVIVLVLVSYIATSLFYMVSDSWVQPMVVSPTDEKVLTLKSQLAEQTNLRDKVALELQHTERYIADQQEFQSEFIKAVQADLAERKTTLRRLRRLASGFAGARDQVTKSNSAFAKQSKRQMRQEYAAGLIDRSTMLAGSFQLAQITSSNMTLAERQSEFESRAEALDAEARALEAILSEKQADGVLSYEILKVKQEYDSSRLESAKALEAREALRSSLARYDAIIESIRQSPHLRAADHTAHVAFVPYANLDDVEPGAPVYGCALEFFACSEVGKVIEVMPGEVAGNHPMRDKNLRGQMVELELEDADAVAKNVLFVGSKPLLF